MKSTSLARVFVLVFLFSLYMPKSRMAGPVGEPWRNQDVIYLDKSPYAKLHTVPIHAVSLNGGFWAERRSVALKRSIPTAQQLLEANGYVDNFRRVSNSLDVPRKGPVFTDSDLYKWIEAVGFFLQSGDQPKLRSQA